MLEHVMSATPSPQFGSYHGPTGTVIELHSPPDVYALFQALLRRMPRVSCDKRTGQSCPTDGRSRGVK